jgi:hypothetical protein
MTGPRPYQKSKARKFLVFARGGERESAFTMDAGAAIRKTVSGRCWARSDAVCVVDVVATGYRYMGIPDGEGWKLDVSPIQEDPAPASAVNLQIGNAEDGARCFVVIFGDGQVVRVAAPDSLVAFNRARKAVKAPSEIVFIVDPVATALSAEDFDQGRFSVRWIEPERPVFRATVIGGAVRLRDCPTGPFLHEGRLGLKTATDDTFDVATGELIRGRALEVKSCTWRKEGNF